MSIQSTTSALRDEYTLLLMDLDGVVYVGPDAVPGAVEALNEARERGLEAVYATNNASRPPSAVAKHLTELGLTVAEGDVVTSSQAAVALLSHRIPAGSSVLAVGGPGVVEAIEEAGFTAVFSSDDQPVGVVQGYGPEVGWKHLAQAAYAIQAGAVWVATNTDLTVPQPGGIAPGNGSLVAAVRVAVTVDPLVAGKPQPTLFTESVLRADADKSIVDIKPLVVGDRLDTDIEGAVNASMPSLLVFTGVTTPRDVILAPAAMRPTYLGADLASLSQRHPEVTSTNGEWSCGAWSACVEGEAVEVWLRTAEDDNDPVDAVRAGCAAAWASETAITDVRGLPPVGVGSLIADA